MDYKVWQATQIRQLCAQHRCPERAEGWTRKGLTPKQVEQNILDLYKSGTLAVPAAKAAPIVDMGKAAGGYSYKAAIQTAIRMREGGPLTGFEVEIHQEIAKNLPQTYSPRGGIFVPLRVSNAALTTGGVGTGAELVGTEAGELINRQSNLSVATRLGALPLIDLRGPVTFPKLVGGTTATWVHENSESGVTPSNPTFGTMTMQAKTLQAQVVLSRQLLGQSTPAAENLVLGDIALSHALAWDLAALHGSGTNNQPLGLYNNPAVEAVSMGGVPAWEKLVDMETAINDVNAMVDSPAFATTPKMAGKLQKVLDFPDSAAARPIWTGNAFEGVVKGCRAVSSNQLRSDLGDGQNEHGLILGVWSDLLIGLWGAVEIIADPYSLADVGLVKLTSFQMADIGPRRPESFRKATGATIF